MCEYVWLWIARVTSQSDLWPMYSIQRVGGGGWPCVAWSRHLFIVDRKYWDKSKIDLVDNLNSEWNKIQSTLLADLTCKLIWGEMNMVVNLKWKRSVNQNKLICAVAIYMLCCCHCWSHLQIVVKSNFSFI